MGDVSSGPKAHIIIFNGLLRSVQGAQLKRAARHFPVLNGHLFEFPLRTGESGETVEARVRGSGEAASSWRRCEVFSSSSR